MKQIFGRLSLFLLIVSGCMGGLVSAFLPSFSAVHASSYANILMYHRFGEGKYPSTNTTMEQFEQHLDALKAGGYQVMPLMEIVRRLDQKLDLPERAVALTVDDAYASFAKRAWPLLRERGLPVTVFVATAPVDAQSSGQPSVASEEHRYLHWDEIREIKAQGVAIQSHGTSHGHFPHMTLEQVKEDLLQASDRFEQELGYRPNLLVYPYGEYSLAITEMVQELGFKAAFSQYSSPASHSMPLYALPRFALNERYGSADRVKMILGTKALPVSDILPRDPVLIEGHNPPLFGFTVDGSIEQLNGLSCFPSHLGRAADMVKPSPNRVEIRFDKPFPKGRSRINCTMPAGDGRYYWLGQYFLVR